MKTIISKISMDLKAPAQPPVIHAVQGERNCRIVELTLLSDGEAWTVPEGSFLAVRYGSGPLDGGYYDTLPDGSPACHFEGNVISVVLAPQMMAGAGILRAQVEILHEAQLLATFSFQLAVEVNPAAGVLQQETYLNWLQWLQSQLTLYAQELKDSGALTGPAGPQGAPAELTAASVTYQAGDSGTEIPQGTWSEAVPAVPQGKYLWTKVVNTFNSGTPVTAYSVSRMGMDGTGSVVAVADVAPDAKGNVPLAPEDIGALAETGGTMQGPIDMNGQKLSGLKDPTADTEAATKGYVLSMNRKAAPRNLLDNSDFRDPVNQRGQTLYKGSGYGIDRWLCTSGNWNVSIEEGCIRYYSDTPASSTGMLQQKIAVTPANRGKTVTLAARVKGDYVRLNINNNATGTYYKDASAWTTLKLTGVVPEEGDTFFVALQNNKGTGVEGFRCEWIALYEGEYTEETLPEYPSRGYQEELLACRQYDCRTGEYIGLRDLGYARNLLDNSDFTDLVAQAGILGTHGTQVYLADRWTTAGYAPAYEEDTGTVTFSAEGVGMIQQVVAGDISGKTVTLAVKARDITGDPKLSESGAQSGHADVQIREGITTHTFVAENNMRVLIWSNADASLAIDWIALYEGNYTDDTLPAYQPKGYGAELLACQRYYQLRSSNDISAMDLRPAMRIDTPTVAAVAGGYSYSADL